MKPKDSAKTKTSTRSKDRGSKRSESPKRDGGEQHPTSEKKQIHWRTVSPRTTSKSSTPAKTHGSRKSSTNKEAKAGGSSRSGSSSPHEGSSNHNQRIRNKDHKYHHHLLQEFQDSATEYPKYPYITKPRTSDKGVSTPPSFKAVKNVRIGTSDDLFWNSPPPPYGWTAPSHTSLTCSNSGRNRAAPPQESRQSSSSIRSPMDKYRRRDEAFSSIHEDEVWKPPSSESFLSVSSEPKTNPSNIESVANASHPQKIMTARTLSLPTMIRIADQQFPQGFSYQRTNYNESRSWCSSKKMLALGLMCGFLYMIAMMTLAVMMIMTDDDKPTHSAETYSANSEQAKDRIHDLPPNSGTDPRIYNATTVVPS